MRYSLLSRFQGALWGAALGEELGWYWLQRSPSTSPHSISACFVGQHFHQWQPNVQSAQPSASCLGRDVVACARLLIQLGGRAKFELEPLKRQSGEVALLDEPELMPDSEPVTSAGLAVTALPIALFFHDNEVKLRQALLSTGLLSQSAAQTGVLTIGFAIAQALKEQLLPHTLIPQTIAYLQQSAHSSESDLSTFINKLEQVQTLLQQGYGLHPAVNLIQNSFSRNQIDQGEIAIAVALYCFLSAPNDLRLAALRAAHAGYLPQVVCPLTTALAGVYHSAAGLPLAWSMAIDAQLGSWGLSGREISHLAAQLLARWSGVWNVTNSSESLPAIAAPGVIRPR